MCVCTTLGLSNCIILRLLEWLFIICEYLFHCLPVVVSCLFSNKVTAPSDLTVLMGAFRESVSPHPTIQGKSVTSFSQKVPIPSYLLALVVGALESR